MCCALLAVVADVAAEVGVAAQPADFRSRRLRRAATEGRSSLQRHPAGLASAVAASQFIPARTTVAINARSPVPQRRRRAKETKTRHAAAADSRAASSATCASFAARCSINKATACITCRSAAEPVVDRRLLQPADEALAVEVARRRRRLAALLPRIPHRAVA